MSKDVQSQFGFNWNAMRTVFGKPCTQTISQIRKILVDSYKISDNCICDPNDFNKTTDTAKGLSLAVVDTSVLSKCRGGNQNAECWLDLAKGVRERSKS